MGLKISGLNEFREHLERLRPEEVMARVLAEQAERMAASVREGLSEPSGAAGHDEPWLQSGALRDSVGTEADGLQAVVGSSDPAAVPQEMGTAKMEARPFLAPVAAAMGEEVAQAVGARVAAALRGDDPGTGAADERYPDAIQVSSTSVDKLALWGALAVLLGLALKEQSSGPNVPGPTRAPPLMNQPPPVGDEGSSPEEGADPVKPAFKPNDAHNPRSQDHNPSKDPEPPDAEEVYKDAQRNPKPERHVWYGKNAKGEWYQYREDGMGTAHYAGTVKRERVPITIREF